MELWTQVFQEMEPQDWLNQMTTCRLFHSLLQAKLYEEVQIKKSNEENGPLAKAPQSTLFVQSLTARPELFGLVRTLRLYPSDEYDLFDDEVTPEDNYLVHPVLRQLPYFPHLRTLCLADIHIDVDCYTAIRSIPRLEYLEVDGCDIDAAILDLQPLQGNTISALFINHPKDGHGWEALVTSGLRTLIVVNTYEDLHMDKVLRGLLSCDLRRTLTKLEWTLEDIVLQDLCQFIEPCVLIESLSIKHRCCPDYNVATRFSYFDELSSKALPMLSELRGIAEYSAALVAGRPVHSVSLQLWENAPKDVLLALQRSKVPVTKLVLSEGHDLFTSFSLDIGLYLEHAPGTIEILSLEKTLDMKDLQSLKAALFKLSDLHTIKCTVAFQTFASDPELVQFISEACPSIRNIILVGSYPFNGQWVWRDDGTWEHYPVIL